MGVGIICPRIVIVGCSFIVPYLDVIWYTLLTIVFSFCIS